MTPKTKQRTLSLSYFLEVSWQPNRTQREREREREREYLRHEWSDQRGEIEREMMVGSD